MSDTFSFHAPAEVFRRRLDPRWVCLGILVALLAVALGTFARWVVASEVRSDALRASALAGASEPVATPAPSPAVAFDDAAAMAAAETALTVARDVHRRTGSYADASTAAMAEAVPELIFVDGPSTASAIVSVTADAHAWAGAVMGADGTCFWVTVTSTGAARYGTGSECTGEAAIAAIDLAW